MAEAVLVSQLFWKVLLTWQDTVLAALSGSQFSEEIYSFS